MGNTIIKMRFTELDNVSGGTANAPDDYYVACIDGHTCINASTACEILRGIWDQFGHDVAIEFAKSNWIPTSDWKNYGDAGGPEYAVQMIWGKGYEGAYHLNGPLSGM